MANRRFGLYRSYVTINPPASSACNDSAENWVDAKAASCFKVQKSSRTARSRQHGLSFPDRGQVIFPGCAARAALKVTLEKGPMDGWIIGSNDSSALSVLSEPRQQVSQAVSRQHYLPISNPARTDNVSRRKHRSRYDHRAIHSATVGNPNWLPVTVKRSSSRSRSSLWPKTQIRCWQVQ
jgi:hypothetical protein